MGLFYVLFSTTFSSDCKLENKLFASAVVPNRAEWSYDMGSSEELHSSKSSPHGVPGIACHTEQC